MDARTIERMDPVRYTMYLNLLRRVFKDVRRYYRAQEKVEKTTEAESMALYAKKFLETIRALRLKFLYSPMYLARPSIDLHQSGFPHFYDICQLDADRSTREERLPKIPETDLLKQLLLEHVMSVGSSTANEADTEKLNSYLWQISERAYLERLDLRVQFFQFTPGKLIPITSAEGHDGDDRRRSYMFSWGCYDAETNCPYVYIMLLEQELAEQPLDAPDNPEYVKFLDTVRHIAARAPMNLMAIAARLDESFRTLYPKALKRLCVGPLVSPLLHKNIGAVDPSSLPARLQPIFERADVADNDYVLCFRVEYVMSEREERPRGLLSALSTQKAKQIFHVPKNDRELMRRGASAVVSYVLMSHQLRQHLLEEDLAAVPELVGATYLVYQTNGGEIVDVS